MRKIYTVQYTKFKLNPKFLNSVNMQFNLVYVKNYWYKKKKKLGLIKKSFKLGNACCMYYKGDTYMQRILKGKNVFVNYF